MAQTGEGAHGFVRDAVVRSFARAVERPCARPYCAAPARSTLTFNYATRDVWLERLGDEPRPQTYDLCATHAARTHPPHGWSLRDRRPEDERHPAVPPPTPADLGGDRTVAVLAAALRAVSDPVSEDAVDATTPEVGPAVATPAAAPLASEPAEAAVPPPASAAEQPLPSADDMNPAPGARPRPVIAARDRASRRTDPPAPPQAGTAATW